MSDATPSRACFRAAVLAAAFSILVSLLFCAVQTARAVEPPDLGPGAERELAARGSVTYRVYCASCHGRAARGDGKLADLLDAEPANLTLIGWRNEDRFPVDHVYQVIDGREEVSENGRREMPVWGEALGATEEAAGLAPERIEAKIWELVYYLKSIQAQGP
ncbi:MAG: c-type cytochrome [Acidobacteriota bacterium]